MKQISLIFALVAAAALWGDDYYDGKRALDAGNYAKAHQSLERACDMGYSDACKKVK